MGKKEVWGELQKMDAAGAFNKWWHWLNISKGYFQCWRWLANIAQDRIDFGVREARVKKNDDDWFQFLFVNDPDLAQPVWATVASRNDLYVCVIVCVRACQAAFRAYAWKHLRR